MFNGGHGDDVDAIVLEVGSKYTKIGYAGEDRPRYYSPTLACTRGSSSYYSTECKLSDPNDGTNLNTDLINAETGLVDNWQDMETYLSYIFNKSSTFAPSKSLSSLKENRNKGDHMMTDVDEVVQDPTIDDPHHLSFLANHPLLMLEPNYQTTAQREKWIEMCFETLDVPAYFTCKQAVSTCFANGRSNGIVVDVGYNKTTIVPVHDGYALVKQMQVSSLAGKIMDEYLDNLMGHPLQQQQQQQQSFNSLDQPTTAVVPAATATATASPAGAFDKSVLPNNSFRTYWKRHALQDMKESICRVSDVVFDVAQIANIPKISYELPDGLNTVVELGSERFQVPEILFHNHAPTLSNAHAVDLRLHGLNIETHSVQKMVYDAIMSGGDMDLRREFFHNVILTGGGSCFENTQVRLERELASMVPTNHFKVKVFASHPPERKIGSWLGGSILASLGSFHETWISKTEYAEHGTSIVHRKCP